MLFASLLRHWLKPGTARGCLISSGNVRVVSLEYSSHSENDSSDSSSTPNSEDESPGSHTKEEEILEDKILSAALPYVNSSGWSMDAIVKGAQSLGYSSMIHGMFPGGGTDLVNFFYQRCNHNLEHELKNLPEDSLVKAKGTTVFIRNAVELRLRMNIPYMENWAQAAALHASPTNCQKGTNNICTLVDHIWYHAGDKSSDFSWYTKRTTLALVYKSSELCMLQDKSNDYEDTWLFLDRRLNDLKAFAKCLREAETRTKDVGSIGKAGLITAFNILGMNIKAR